MALLSLLICCKEALRCEQKHMKVVRRRLHGKVNVVSVPAKPGGRAHETNDQEEEEEDKVNEDEGGDLKDMDEEDEEGEEEEGEEDEEEDGGA
jgi:hypothetical protein